MLFWRAKSKMIRFIDIQQPKLTPWMECLIYIYPWLEKQLLSFALWIHYLRFILILSFLSKFEFISIGLFIFFGLILPGDMTTFFNDTSPLELFDKNDSSLLTFMELSKPRFIIGQSLIFKSSGKPKNERPYL